MKKRLRQNKRKSPRDLSHGVGVYFAGAPGLCRLGLCLHIPANSMNKLASDTNRSLLAESLQPES